MANLNICPHCHSLNKPGYFDCWHCNAVPGQEDRVLSINSTTGSSTDLATKKERTDGDRLRFYIRRLDFVHSVEEAIAAIDAAMDAEEKSK